MYNYTTVAALTQAYPYIGSMTTITSAVIAARFIAPAETLINGKLSKLYTVPLSDAAGFPLLETVANGIAIYWMLSRRVYPQERMTKSDWPDRFKEAMDMLDEMASGEIPIFTGSGVVISQNATDGAGQPYSSTMDMEPTFKDYPEELYSAVDPLKLDAVGGSVEGEA